MKPVTDKRMKKVVLGNGREYSVKKLCSFVITAEMCVFTKYKEMVIYNNGMIVIKMEDGVYKRIVRDNIEKMFRVFFYDTGGIADEIVFEVESIERGWEAIFVYLFDEGGAHLLCAHKKTLPIVGAYICSGNEGSYSDIRGEAFNMAALFQKDIVDKLLSMERVSKECGADATLLSVGGGNEK